jgi:hypothetical protein
MVTKSVQLADRAINCVVTHITCTRVDIFDNYEIAVNRPSSKHLSMVVMGIVTACT